MAANRTRAEGRQLKITATSGGVASGDPVAMGNLVGVALYPKDGSNVTVMDTRGVYHLNVASIDAAINPGDIVYYVPGDTPKLSDDVDGVGAVRFGTVASGTVANGNTTTSVDVKLGYN